MDDPTRCGEVSFRRANWIHKETGSKSVRTHREEPEQDQDPIRGRRLPRTTPPRSHSFLPALLTPKSISKSVSVHPHPFREPIQEKSQRFVLTRNRFVALRKDRPSRTEPEKIEFVSKADNSPNTPQNRPIELFWALCKREYKSQNKPCDDIAEFRRQWTLISKKVAEKHGQALFKTFQKSCMKLARTACLLL